MKLNDLSFTGTTAVAVRPTDKVSVLKKLDAIYDEGAKLVFLFDVSGSMSSRIARSYTEQYNFTPEVIAGIRAAVAEAIALANCIDVDFDCAEELTPLQRMALNLIDERKSTDEPRAFNATDEELKERVVRYDLTGEFGATVNWEKHNAVPPSRMDVVRTLSKQEIQRRFEKYPKGQIAVIKFGGVAEIVFDEGRPADLWPILEAMHCNESYSGDTRILTAIRAAMDSCRARPSEVGVHHFILVTDGGDYVADANIGSWVPSMKASGIVLDYIHIGDCAKNEGVAAACKALGGEYVVVNSERDLTEKFVEAVQRKMLPPASV